MNNLPKVVTQNCLEQDLNPRPTDRKPKCLTTAPIFGVTSVFLLISVVDKVEHSAGRVCQENNFQTKLSMTLTFVMIVQVTTRYSHSVTITMHSVL